MTRPSYQWAWASVRMLPTWTGAKVSASWITTRPPVEVHHQQVVRIDRGPVGRLRLGEHARRGRPAAASAARRRSPRRRGAGWRWRRRRPFMASPCRREGAAPSSISAPGGLTLRDGRAAWMAVLGAVGGQRRAAARRGALRLARRRHQSAARPQGPVRQGPSAGRRRLCDPRRLGADPRSGRDTAGRRRLLRPPDLVSGLVHLLQRPAALERADRRPWRGPGADAGDAAELRRAVRRGGRPLCAALSAGEPLHQVDAVGRRAGGAPVRLRRREGGVRDLPRALQPRPAVHPGGGGAGRRAGRAAAAPRRSPRTRTCASAWSPPT